MSDQEQMTDAIRNVLKLMADGWDIDDAITFGFMGYGPVELHNRLEPYQSCHCRACQASRSADD